MPVTTQRHSPRPTRDNAPLTLRVAYTPDSDDAFNFYAWEHGKVSLPGATAAVFARDHIIALNRAALAGRFDLTSISSVIYPLIADRYSILGVGTSVGRGYGPVLVSKRLRSISETSGRRIAVGGFPTTGGVLAAMYCPGAHLVEMPYDRIASAILADEVDAGVMIHEELVFFRELGLHKVACLGATWCEQTGLPLPVGLNVVHRRLGREMALDIARVCRASLEWGREHLEEAVAFASRFGRGCARQFIDMFSNDDTHHLHDDVREALGLLLRRTADLGITPRLEEVEVLDVY